VTDSMYKRALQWIADNDEPMETDVEAMSELISVLLIADLYDVSPRAVADGVMRLRRRPNGIEAR
jgi:hypothetical protein